MKARNVVIIVAVVVALILTYSLYRIVRDNKNNMEEINNNEEINAHDVTQVEDTHLEGVSKNEIAMNEKRNSNLNDLIEDNQVNLTISQDGGPFIPASKDFTNRVLELLARHDEPVSGDPTVNNCDVILRFEGYQDICLNTDYESFWFKDSKDAYKSSLATRWDRYIIKIIDGEPRYDSFDKTIISKTREDQILDYTAILYNDGDIRLTIKDAEIVIEENFSEDNVYLRNFEPKDAGYGFKRLAGTELFSLTDIGYGARSRYVNQRIYKYHMNEIQEVWSTHGIHSNIQDIDFEKGILYFELPTVNEHVALKFTQDEYEAVIQKVKELKSNGIVINKEYIHNIKENLICSVGDTHYMDMDEDGLKEIILTIEFRTVGATTPFSIYERALLIFDIKEDEVHYSDIILDRDHENEALDFLYEKLER